MSVGLNEFGVSDQEVDDWVFQEEFHYYRTIQDVAELISIYGWQQVLKDINEAVGWKKTAGTE